jgi:lysozyme
MSAPANITEQLYRDEGCVLKAYTCPTGHLTIGIGRNLETTGLSEKEAEYLLEGDIKRVTEELLAALKWTHDLDAARFGVLQNMCFNLGLNGLLGFHDMLAAFRRRDWQRAAEELLDSTYAKQVGARADRLATQTRTGAWQ